MLNRQSTLALAAFGVAFVLGLAPAGASTLASFHALIPASPVYSIEKLDTITVTGCPVERRRAAADAASAGARSRPDRVCSISAGR